MTRTYHDVKWMLSDASDMLRKAASIFSRLGIDRTTALAHFHDQLFEEGRRETWLSFESAKISPDPEVEHLPVTPEPPQASPSFEPGDMPF